MNASILSNIEGDLSREEIKHAMTGEPKCVLYISESHWVEFWKVEYDGQDPTGEKIPALPSVQPNGLRPHRPAAGD